MGITQRDGAYFNHAIGRTESYGPTYKRSPSTSHDLSAPDISIREYLRRLTTYAELSPLMLLTMTHYILILCSSGAKIQFNELTVQRVLIACATVATKGLSDFFNTNARLAIIGEVPRKELALLELDLLKILDWTIVPKAEELCSLYRSLVENTEGYAFLEDYELSRPSSHTVHRTEAPPPKHTHKRSQDLWKETRGVIGSNTSTIPESGNVLLTDHTQEHNNYSEPSSPNDMDSFDSHSRERLAKKSSDEELTDFALKPKASLSTQQPGQPVTIMRELSEKGAHIAGDLQRERHGLRDDGTSLALTEAAFADFGPSTQSGLTEKCTLDTFTKQPTLNASDKIPESTILSPERQESPLKRRRKPKGEAVWCVFSEALNNPNTNTRAGKVHYWADRGDTNDFLSRPAPQLFDAKHKQANQVVDKTYVAWRDVWAFGIPIFALFSFVISLLSSVAELYKLAKTLDWYPVWCIIGWFGVILFVLGPKSLTLGKPEKIFSMSSWQLLQYDTWSVMPTLMVEMLARSTPHLDNLRHTEHVSQLGRYSKNVYGTLSIHISSTLRRFFLPFYTNSSRLAQTRPRGNAEKKRVHNQCRCGYRFSDDFQEVRAAAAATYSDILQRRLSMPNDHTYDRAQVSGTGTTRSQTSSPISTSLGWTGGLRAFAKRVRGRQDGGPSLPQHRSETGSNETPRSAAPNNDLLFLLLCIPQHQHATKLLQPQISALKSDKEFFQLLRANYKQMRGRMKGMLSLKTLRNIKFVQLEMYKSELVDIRKQDDMPPESQKDQYRYNPMPAEIVPPVGENHMLHLIKHPTHAEDDGLLLDRIPKKLRGRLLVCSSRGTGLGWGIYFIEGWHISVITLVAFAIVLAGSLVFLICWSVLKQDVQGASGVAAYMIAFLGLAIGSVQALFELT